MPALRIALVSGLSLLVVGSSCQSNEAAVPAPMPDCPRQVPTTVFAALDGVIFKPYLQNIGASYNRVIDSDSAYQALYSGYAPFFTPPPIDFTTHTLLIGKTHLSTIGMRATQQVTKTCEGRYTYAVQISRGAGQAEMDVVYHALLDKLPAAAQVDFEVQVLY